MRVTWEVDEGYCGKSRPQHTSINDDDLAECGSDEEREQLISDTIQADFDQRITWYEVSRE